MKYFVRFCGKCMRQAAGVDKEEVTQELARHHCDSSPSKSTASSSAPVKALLDFATDEQLRAECERRGRRSDGAMRPEWLAADELLSEVRRRGLGDQLMAERDEWKRRAIAAEADHDTIRNDAVEWKRRAEAAEARLMRALVDEKRAALDRADESGPGIAATPPRDDGHYVDPLDLLADDA